MFSCSDRRKFLSLSFGCCVYALLSGCGGGGKITIPEVGTEKPVDFTISVEFSSQGRAKIPGYADRVTINLKGKNYDNKQDGNRPSATGGVVAKTFSNVPVGDYIITVTGYSGGNVVSSGEYNYKITKTETIVFTNSTDSIQSVAIRLDNGNDINELNIIQGDYLKLNIVTKNQENQIVLLQEGAYTAEWRSSDLNVATVSNNGELRGILSGKTQISVTLLGGAVPRTKTITCSVSTINIPNTRDLWIVASRYDPDAKLTAGLAGRGYNLSSLSPLTNSVFTQSITQNTEIDDVYLSVALVQSSQTTQISSEYNFSAKASYVKFKGGADFNSQRKFSSSSNSISVQITYFKRFKPDFIQNPSQWNQEALSQFNSNISNFNSKYGDYAIVGRIRHVRVKLNIELSNISAQESRALAASFNANFTLGVVKVESSASIKQFLATSLSSRTANFTTNAQGTEISGLPNPPLKIEDVDGWLNSAYTALKNDRSIGTDGEYIMVPYETLRSSSAPQNPFPNSIDLIYKKFVTVDAARAALERIILNKNGEYNYLYPWNASKTDIIRSSSVMDQLNQGLIRIRQSVDSLNELYKKIQTQSQLPVQSSEIDVIYDGSDLPWPNPQLRPDGFGGGFVTRPASDDSAVAFALEFRSRITGGNYGWIIIEYLGGGSGLNPGRVAKHDLSKLKSWPLRTSGGLSTPYMTLRGEKIDEDDGLIESRFGNRGNNDNFSIFTIIRQERYISYFVGSKWRISLTPPNNDQIVVWTRDFIVDTTPDTSY